MQHNESFHGHGNHVFDLKCRLCFQNLHKSNFYTLFFFIVNTLASQHSTKSGAIDVAAKYYSLLL